MPIMSAIVYLITLLYFYNIEISSSTCHSTKSAVTVTSKVFLSPKNMYLKWPDNSLPSWTSGSIIASFARGVSLSFKSMSKSLELMNMNLF